MITINNILHIVDELRPNAVSDEMKLGYLNEIEGEVFDILTHYEGTEEIILTNVEARKLPGFKGEAEGAGVAPVQPEDWQGDPLNMGKPKKKEPILKLKPYGMEEREAILLLDERFRGVYTSYLMAKIDFVENETQDYTNDSILHAAEKQAFLDWISRTYMHKQPRVRGLR